MAKRLRSSDGGNGAWATRVALQTALAYSIVGMLWILLSDRVVYTLAADTRQSAVMQMYKGYAFVATTAGLLFVLVRVQVGRLVAADRRRRQSEDQFRNAFEHSITGMSLVGPDLRLMRVNDVFCRMLGYPREALIGRDATELVHPDDREGRLAYLRALVEGSALPRPMEVRYLRRDGGVTWMLAASVLQRDDSGRPLYLVSQLVDVTPLRRAEEQSRRQSLELAHAARLISLGELSSGLAHELNQPLGAILHYAEACEARLTEGPLDEAGRASMLDALGDAVAQAERARQIVLRFGGMAKKQTPRVDRVDVNRLVTEAAGMLGPQMERHRVVLGMELGRSLPEVAADPVQATQVLLNLGVNAIEAVAELPASDRWVRVRTWREEDRVRVAVRDGGHTLTPEVASRLFESFFTTKPEGWGLGLAISKAIVEAHGGRLTMRRGERWTEFEFSLPSMDDQTWLQSNHAFG